MEGRKGDRVAATGLWAGQRAATSHRLACGGKRDKLAGVGGGQGGIRTHGRLPPTAVFKTAALNHSATCPARLGALACIAVKRRVIQAESAGQAEAAARVERVTSQMPPQTRIRAIK